MIDSTTWFGSPPDSVSVLHVVLEQPSPRLEPLHHLAKCANVHVDGPIAVALKTSFAAQRNRRKSSLDIKWSYTILTWRPASPGQSVECKEVREAMSE